MFALAILTCAALCAQQHDSCQHGDGPGDHESKVIQANDISLPPQQLEDLRSRGLMRRHRFALTKQIERMKIVVRDQTTGRMGSLMNRFPPEVDDRLKPVNCSPTLSGLREGTPL